MTDSMNEHHTIFDVCSKHGVQYFDEVSAEFFLKERIQSILDKLKDLNLLHFSLIDDIDI